jgi:predicted LPLAT superfamily acyltransferase
MAKLGSSDMASNSPQHARAADWAEPGMGARWQQKFFHTLIRLGGKNRGYHMAAIVSAWYVLFYPSIRRRCRHYLKRRFPDHTGFFRRLLDTYRLVRTFATTLVDMIIPGILGPGALRAESPDRERLLALCSQPRGFVLLHAHVGCWQMGMSTLSHFPKRASIVMIPEARTVALFGDRATAIDPRTGLDGVMRMTEALLDGQIVAMMGDRAFGSEANTVAVNFLGAPASFPVAPYRLASAAGVPVVVMTVPKTARDAYAVRLSRIIDVPAGLGRQANVYAPYAQQFADCIAEFTLQWPWQYHNFYDLWAASPGAGKVTLMPD